MADDKGTVCVTGAGGFIGTHVVDALLRAGYRVRGTVRNADDPAKTAHLRALGDVDLRSADLGTAGAFDALVYAMSLFDKQLSVAFLRRNLGVQRRFDASLAERTLDVSFRPPEESILDTARSAREAGWC